MAKNQNEDIDLVNDMDLDDEEEKDGKKNGKMMTSIVALFIVLIWVAIFALLIKLDVGGFGSSVMYPVLKNVPVLNKILPKNAGEEISSQSGDTYSTLQDAIDRINELENEISLYKSNADDNAETISNLQAELSRLKAYEENQSNYEQLKKKFDNEVVFTNNAPDIQEYKTWYEQMDPDNAAEIYRQVVEIQDLADKYASMKPAAAAAVFEEMTGDLEKVAKILSCMKKADAGNIIAAMDPTLAAKLTLLIYPTGE